MAETQLPPEVNEAIQWMKTEMADRSATWHATSESRQQQVEALYESVFDLYHTVLFISHELGQQIVSAQPQNTDDNDYLLMSMINIHGSAYIVAREVEVLLRNGFNAGAMARWRTLHELCVIGLFISSEGAETAKKFLDHEKVKRLQSEEAHLKFLIRMQDEPSLEHANKRLAEIEQQRAAINKEQQLEKFSEDYGWAWHVFDRDRKPSAPKNIPTFHQIEARMNASMPQFQKEANFGIHASAATLAAMTGNPLLDRTDELVPYTVTCSDIVLPALWDYVWCTKLLFDSHPLINGSVMIPAFRELMEEAFYTALEVEKACQPKK